MLVMPNGEQVKTVAVVQMQQLRDVQLAEHWKFFSTRRFGCKGDGTMGQNKYVEAMMLWRHIGG